MSNTHNIYLISDSTGETLDRIFTALKAQFENLTIIYFISRSQGQRTNYFKILEDAKKKEESIILYTIVDSKLAKFLSQEATKKIYHGVLGDLILNFSKLLDQKATNIPSGQHVLNEEYYSRIEAIQFTMNRDDGNSLSDVEKSDIILLGLAEQAKPQPQSI